TVLVRLTRIHVRDEILPRDGLIWLLLGALGLFVNSTLELIHLALCTDDDTLVLQFPNRYSGLLIRVVLNGLEGVHKGVVPRRVGVLIPVRYPREGVAVSEEVIGHDRRRGPTTPLPSRPDGGHIPLTYASGEALDKKSCSCASDSKPLFAPSVSSWIAFSTLASSLSGE